MNTNKAGMMITWVCGFANANGGVIYIGKDDNGRNLLPFVEVGGAPEIVLSETFID